MQASVSGISPGTAILPLLAISVAAGAKLQIGLRFVHGLAGILWVGLLYFLNLVNLRFQSGKPVLFQVLCLAKIVRIE